jgi:hypothetical protein
MSRLRHVRFIGQDFVYTAKKIFGAGCTLELNGDLIITLVVKDEDIIVRFVLHTETNEASVSNPYLNKNSLGTFAKTAT